MASEVQIASAFEEEAAAKASARMSVAYQPPDITKIGGKGNVRLVTATQSKMCLVRNLADVICIDPARSHDASCSVPGLPPQLVRTTAGVYAHSSAPLGAAPAAADPPYAHDGTAAAAKRPCVGHDGAADARTSPVEQQTAGGGGATSTGVPRTANGSIVRANGRTSAAAAAGNEQRRQDGSQRTCSVCAQPRPLSEFRVAMATCAACRRLRKRARDVRMDIAELARRVRSGSIEFALQERELSGPGDPVSAAANTFLWQRDYRDWQQGQLMGAERGPRAPTEWDGAWLRGGGGRFVIGPRHELSEVMPSTGGGQASPRGAVALVDLLDTVNGRAGAAPTAGATMRAAARRKSVPERLSRAAAADDGAAGEDSASEAQEGAPKGPRKTSCTICLAPNTGARCKQCNIYCARAYTHGVGLDVLRVAVQEGWAHDLLPLRKHGRKPPPAPPDHATCPNCDQVKPTSEFPDNAKPPRAVLCSTCTEAHDGAKRRAAELAADLHLSATTPPATRASAGAAAALATRPSDAPAQEQRAAAAQPPLACDMCPNPLAPNDTTGRCDRCTSMFGVQAGKTAPQRRPEAPQGAGARMVVTIDSDSGDDEAAAPRTRVDAHRNGARGPDAAPPGGASLVQQLAGALGGAGGPGHEALLAEVMQQLIRVAQSDQRAQRRGGVAPPQHASAEQVIQQLGMQLDRNEASLNLPSIMGLGGSRDAAMAPAAPPQLPGRADEHFRNLLPPRAAAMGPGHVSAPPSAQHAADVQLLERILGQALPFVGARAPADVPQRQRRGSDQIILSLGYPPDARANGRGGGWDQRALPVQPAWGRAPSEATVPLDTLLNRYPPPQAPAVGGAVAKAIGHVTYVPSGAGDELSHLSLAEREARQRGPDDAPRADSQSQQPAAQEHGARPNGGASAGLAFGDAPLGRGSDPFNAAVMHPRVSGGSRNVDGSVDAAAAAQSAGLNAAAAVRSAAEPVDTLFGGHPAGREQRLWGARLGSHAAPAGARAAPLQPVHRSDSASDVGRGGGSSELGHVGLAQIYNDITAPPPMRQLDSHGARAVPDVTELLRGHPAQRLEHASYQEILGDPGGVSRRAPSLIGLAGADSWPAREGSQRLCPRCRSALPAGGNELDCAACFRVAWQSMQSASRQLSGVAQAPRGEWDVAEASSACNDHDVRR